jgi:NTP pyrophosphatase (non-canonical NTP hydrolase)
MTFQEYQQLALRTAPPPSPHSLEDLLHGVLGVGTEGGELLDIVKKNQFYGKPIDWVNVREEIGDVLWYLALLARASGTTLEACGELNIKKLEKRYPKAFTAQRALHRDLEDERRALEMHP